MQEIADLIDDQDGGMRVVFQAPAQGLIPILGRQVAEHLAGVDEQGAVTLHDRLMREVLRDH